MWRCYLTEFLSWGLMLVNLMIALHCFTDYSSFFENSTFDFPRIGNYKDQINALLDLWPDVITEEPLLICDGGREVT